MNIPLVIFLCQIFNIKQVKHVSESKSLLEISLHSPLRDKFNRNADTEAKETHMMNSDMSDSNPFALTDKSRSVNANFVKK